MANLKCKFKLFRHPECRVEGLATQATHCLRTPGSNCQSRIYCLTQCS